MSYYGKVESYEDLKISRPSLYALMKLCGKNNEKRNMLRIWALREHEITMKYIELLMYSGDDKMNALRLSKTYCDIALIKSEQDQIFDKLFNSVVDLPPLKHVHFDLSGVVLKDTCAERKVL